MSTKNDSGRGECCFFIPAWYVLAKSPQDTHGTTAVLFKNMSLYGDGVCMREGAVAEITQHLQTELPRFHPSPAWSPGVLLPACADTPGQENQWSAGLCSSSLYSHPYACFTCIVWIWQVYLQTARNKKACLLLCLLAVGCEGYFAHTLLLLALILCITHIKQPRGKRRWRGRRRTTSEVLKAPSFRCPSVWLFQPPFLREERLAYRVKGVRHWKGKKRVSG